MCRQVLREFARDMPIALVAEQRGRLTRRDTTLGKLLPDAFDGSALKKRKK
jgi:cytidine deaminase